MAGIRIDALDGTSLASRDHELPAMKDGLTVKLTVGQILDLIVGAAPGALDTLEELAAALGDNEEFANTVTIALAARLEKAQNLADLPDKPVARANLGAASAVQAVPVGVVMDFAGTAAPSGWLMCYGQTVSRATYAALFDAIGTAFGAGDGATTFAVPDLRGLVTAGKDNMGGVSANRLTGLSGGVDGDILGASGGSEVHLLTASQIPDHTHNAPATGNFVVSGGGTAAAGSASATWGSSGITGAKTGTSGQSHNNVQPTAIMNKIIFAGV